MAKYATIYIDDRRHEGMTDYARRTEAETGRKPTYGAMLKLALDLWLSQPTSSVRMTPESIELLNDPDRK